MNSAARKILVLAISAGLATSGCVHTAVLSGGQQDRFAGVVWFPAASNHQLQIGQSNTIQGQHGQQPDPTSEPDGEEHDGAIEGKSNAENPDTPEQPSDDDTQPTGKPEGSDKDDSLSPWWYVAGAVAIVGVTAIAIAGSGGGGGGGNSDAFGGQGADPGPIGDFTVVLTWGFEESAMSAGPDLDLIVQDPLGQILSTTREGFALGPTPQGGEIDRDEDGACTTIPDDNGGGPERAFWPTGTAPSGAYMVSVQYTGACGLIPEPDARYTVTVYVRGVQAQQFTGTLGTPGERRAVGSVTFE